MQTIYGRAHRRTRARWAPRVAAGSVSCARCGETIAAGELWHLGHDDSDRERRRYSGPEHVRCNCATSSHRAPRRRDDESHPGRVGGTP